MNLSLRRSTSALLASSLLLTIGRGATLPFMTIYLSRQYSLSVDLIGYAMTIALTIGVVFSLGFGILADKFDKKRYMLLAITAFASGFIAIPRLTASRWWYFFRTHQLRLFRFCHSVESLGLPTIFHPPAKRRSSRSTTPCSILAGPSARHSARCWSCRASICPFGWPLSALRFPCFSFKFG